MSIGARDLWRIAVGMALTFALADALADAGDCPWCGSAGRKNASSNGEEPRPHPEPCEIPTRYYGRWKVSLCLWVKCGDPGHTWLRYENTETHEVHTVGRYQKGHGGTKNPDTGEWVCLPAPISGVIYDLDLRREGQIRRGEIKMLSCYVIDPIVYKGLNGGYGHGGLRRNCVTHCRDGWHYFTGEYYEIGALLESPKELLKEVARRHPEILAGR